MDRHRPLVCPILVGRDDFLDLAERRIGPIRDGTGQLLLKAGEAGLGKTRLLGAIERRAAASGFRTIRGGAYPTDQQVPGAIFLDLARAMRREPSLATFGERLADRLDDRESSERDPNRRRRLLVLDAAELVIEAARDAPTLVSLEDLHWSDDLTLEIVEAIARGVRDVPMLLVGTYRTDEVFPRTPMREWRARLVGQRMAEEVRLARLSPADTATMTTLLLASGLPAARDVVEAVHARTDGIPLHVEELLAHLGREGDPDAGEVRDADVPETLDDAIVARLSHRSARALSVAQAGAVIGRSFDIDLLADVTDADSTTLSEALTELADHFILLPAHAPGRYNFRHAIICDAIYASIPEPERRRLHQRTAAAAARRPDVGTDPFLALQYERAGQPPAAYPAAVAAAEAAAALSSHTEARDLYACALRTAPFDLNAATRARLLEAFATNAAATDDNIAAAGAFEDARSAYLAAGLPLQASAVVAPLVAVRHLLGDDLDARAARLKSGLAEIEGAPSLHERPSDTGPDRVRARLLAALAAAYMLDRRLEESIAYATEARRLARVIGDEPTDRHAATTLGACLVFAGRMDDGWALLEDAIAGALSAQDEAGAGRAYRMIGSCASVLVEYERAERWLREGIEYTASVELWNDRHYMAAHLGHVLWATGRWAEADELALRARADGRGGITTRISALHVRGYVALGRGELIAARTYLDEARALGEGMRELQRLSPALWGLAEVALASADAAGAADLAEVALAASARVNDAAYLFPFLLTGVRAHLALGDPQGARTWLDRVTPIMRSRAVPGTIPAIGHAEGLLALAGGSTGQARTALSAAVGEWERLGRAWEGAWATVDLARCHLRSNQRNEAARFAGVAEDAAERLGAPAITAAAQDVVRASGRGAEPDPWAPLTAREFAIARLIAEGRTNVEIAGELGITRKTVASHVEHILAKLGVDRRAEIAAWAASLRMPEVAGRR